MSHLPHIKAVMKPFPFSIQVNEDALEARRLLVQHGIRHLPVLDGERLVGVLSSRDLDRASMPIAAAGADPVQVGSICSSPAYAVDLDEPLDNVLLHMAEERIGCALVVRAERVVGIFTTTDACRLFAEYLRRDAPPTGDDAA